MSRYGGLMDDKLLFTAREVYRIIKRSMSRNKKRVNAAWENGYVAGNVVGSVRTAIIALLVAIILSLVVNSYKGMKEDIALDKAIDTYGHPETVSMVQESRRYYYHHDTNAVAVDIETLGISEHLADIALNGTPEDFHREMYRVYHEVCDTSQFSDTEIRKIMDEIIENIARLSRGEDGVSLVNHSSFAGYVSSLGCTKERKGEVVADYKEYNEQWEKYFEGYQETFEVTNDLNIGGSFNGRS